jgi:hypothetical protein
MQLLPPIAVIPITPIRISRPMPAICHLLVRICLLRKHGRLDYLTEALITDQPPRSNLHSPYGPPTAASDFQAVISPVLPISSPPPLYDMKHEAASHIQIIPSDEKDVIRNKSSPGWRPDWVNNGAKWIFFTILLILVLYLALYMYGRQKHYMATSNPGTDIVFRFGPALLALIVSIMVGRLADDLAILQPYIALAVGKKSLRNEYGARLTEPTLKEWGRSWLSKTIVLPKKLRK